MEQQLYQLNMEQQLQKQGFDELRMEEQLSMQEKQK